MKTLDTKRTYNAASMDPDPDAREARVRAMAMAYEKRASALPTGNRIRRVVCCCGCLGPTGKTCEAAAAAMDVSAVFLRETLRKGAPVGEHIVMYLDEATGVRT